MIIHTVSEGDSIYSLSKQYGVPESRIVNDNFINPLKRLSIGQTILIGKPTKTYTVRGGDTIEEITKKCETDVIKLIQNNPFLLNGKTIPSQILNIDYNRSGARKLAIAAYTENATINSIEKVLPYLTFLHVQNVAKINGEEVAFFTDPKKIITLSKRFCAIPILSLNIIEACFSIEKLTKSICESLLKHGFCGVELVFWGVSEERKKLFSDTFGALSNLCKKKELHCCCQLLSASPELFNKENIENSNYLTIFSENFLTDDLVKKYHSKMLLTVQTFGIDYGIAQKERKSISMATEALLNGFRTIKRIEKSETPYIEYFSGNGNGGEKRVFYFEDLVSVSKKLDLIDSYNLYGVNIASLEFDFSALWQLLNQRYIIQKFCQNNVNYMPN